VNEITEKVRMMKQKKMWLYGCSAVAVILALIYGAMQGATLDLATVTSGNIAEYVEDTGTVKARSSQTVYLESAGRVIAVLVEKGAVIKQGFLLLKLDPTDQRLAAINAEQAANNYDFAIKDWEKTKKLYASGVISRKEYETAEVAWKNAAKNHQAAVVELEKATRDTLLYAPRAGIILDRLVEPNLYATAGMAAFVIGDLADLEIETEILADEAGKIRPGNLVTVSGKAIGDQILPGKVARIAPMAKNVVSSLGVNQKRFTVTIALTAGHGRLRPGADVDVKIVAASVPRAVKVPLSAVFDYHGRMHVFLVAKGKAILRPVTKGIENDEAIEIKAGLKPGELILTRPDNTVKEGMRVKVPVKP
jgi:HlyD family secretion protein